MKLWELLSPSSQLDEAFDNIQPWSWMKKVSDYWLAKITMTERVFWVYFHNKDGNVSLTFNDDDHSEEVTGKGDAFVVFGTIADIIKNYLRDNQPKTFSFHAKESSRQKLYARMAGELARKTGAQLTTEMDPHWGKGYILNFGEPVEEERVDELLNAPIEWEWARERPQGSIASFYVKDDRIDVTLSLGDGYTDIMFSSKNHGMDITGAGASFQIFATVADICRDFLTRHKPEGIRFSAKEPSRAKLYGRLASLLAKEMGWKSNSQQTSSGTMFYVEPYKDLKEEGKIIPNVNTTVDVQPGETQRQAAKFGNTLDAKSRPPLLRGSYGDDSARFSANQGDPFYGSDGTRLTGKRK